MSGHSKWATIKRQKGAADAKRGQLFTKLSNAITLAVKAGGGVADPDSNFRLRLTVDKARAANMPKENIERAIDRASGSTAAQVEELLYEGFAPGGVAVIVEAVTDNKQRTFSTLKNIFDKGGGTIGSSGSVSYLFKRRGEIAVAKNGVTSDELLGKGIDAGVEDMEEVEDGVLFYSDPQLLQQIKKALESQGIIIESAQLTYIPTSFISADESSKSKVEELIDNLQEIDDVQEVYTNLE